MEENIKFSNLQGIGVPESRERMCTRTVWKNNGSIFFSTIEER